jgi:hypothetical protein
MAIKRVIRRAIQKTGRVVPWVGWLGYWFDERGGEGERREAKDIRPAIVEIVVTIMVLVATVIVGAGAYEFVRLVWGVS